jgi:endoglucanase
MDYFDLLKKYTELAGPTGYEHRVQEEFMKDVEPYVEDVRQTNIGNVIAHVGGAGRRVVAFGHADELAYNVLSITDEGFLHISRGRADKLSYPYTLVGQKALVLGDRGDVRGAFVCPMGHILGPQERDRPLEPWGVLVDIGVDNREDVMKMGVHVGSPIIWNPETERAGDKVFGKAMDDRFTHPVMIELAKRLQGHEPGCDLYLASTVQEEIGQRGAQELARHGFDISLALDIGIAGDYPMLPKDRMPIKLGAGPVITYRDAAIVYNVETIRELREVAERNDIPYQHGIFEHYGSDSAMMVAGDARPSLLCVPCRYSHSPVEMIHLSDVENMVKLLYHYVAG